MPDTQPQDVLSSLSSTGGGASFAAPTAPTGEPPAGASIDTTGDSSTSTGNVGASVWVNSKKINALWAINENRNSWIGVAGVGWVKLANNSDSAIVAFTMLGASAKQTQTNVNYRQEADKMLHEIYVW